MFSGSAHAQPGFAANGARVDMESTGRVGPAGKDSAIAAGSASATEVSLAVAPPSRAGVCGLNSIINVIHGGVSSSVPQLHSVPKVDLTELLPTFCLL